MARCAYQQKVFVDGRKRPIGYLCRRDDRAPLCVPGHYETACGGCDTLPTPDAAYEIVTRHAEAGCDVLYEGIIVQDDVRRCVETAARFPLLVLALATPLDVCLASIERRRADRGDARPLNPKNTIDRARRLEKTIRRLTEAGVQAEWVTREEALARCLSAFGLATERRDVEPGPFQLT